MDTHDQGVIPVDQAKPKPTRARKPKPVDKPNGKRSLNLSLTTEVYERLAVHALADGVTISDLVSQLATTHLRRVHMTRTTRPE